jgi:hypothetical protein
MTHNILYATDMVRVVMGDENSGQRQLVKPQEVDDWL